METWKRQAGQMMMRLEQSTIYSCFKIRVRYTLRNEKPCTREAYMSQDTLLLLNLTTNQSQRRKSNDKKNLDGACVLRAADAGFGCIPGSL